MRPASERDDAYLDELLQTYEFYDKSIQNLRRDRRAVNMYFLRRIAVSVFLAVICACAAFATAHAASVIFDINIFGGNGFVGFRLDKQNTAPDVPAPENESKSSKATHDTTDNGDKVIRKEFDTIHEVYEYLHDTEYYNPLPVLPEKVCGMTLERAELVIAEPNILHLYTDYSDGKQSFRCNAFFNKHADSDAEYYDNTKEHEHLNINGTPCVYESGSDNLNAIYFTWKECNVTVAAMESRDTLISIVTQLLENIK